jgi:hypothetical protein
MHPVFLRSVLITIFACYLTGCQSRQSRIDELQRGYDRLSAQFQTDCSAEYFKVPPTLSPKCADEKKNVEDAGKRLRDEQAKK